MKYFNSLPLTTVRSEDGTYKSYRNLMTRLSVIPSILKNPLVYYTYDIQEGDTPEIVAHKYYGDPFRYWIVLFANESLDPQWDWPLSSNQLQDYIENKYAGTGIDVYSDVKSYRKKITQTDITTNVVTVNMVEISEDEYNSMETYTKTISTSTGSVIVSVEKNIQSYYDYEVEKNESKRTIKLLNKNYVSQVEQEFKTLLM